MATTCDLTTYEPDPSTITSLGSSAIPFARDRLALKIIMRSSYLHDALGELASTQPERLVLTAQKKKNTNNNSSSSSSSSKQKEKDERATPHFGLEAEGPLGSASVEFSMADPSSAAAAAAAVAGPENASFAGPGDGAELDAAPLLETFQVARGRCRQAYKFSLVRNAARAMQLATKVSVRMDEQGVLSLQFMIEVESGDAGAGPAVSFVDFRFVPFVSDESGSEEQDGQDNDDGGDETASDL